MAEVILFNNEKNTLPDTRDLTETVSVATKITAFSVSNSTGASVSYKAYITETLGESVDPIQPQTIVVKDRADPAFFMIGQKIPKGGNLEVESSTGDSLNFYVTGVQ